MGSTSGEREVVLPSVKESLLDHTVLDNFLSVSNLLFLEKMVEKVVTLKLQRTLEKVDCMDHFNLVEENVALRWH